MVHESAKHNDIPLNLEQIKVLWETL